MFKFIKNGLNLVAGNRAAFIPSWALATIQELLVHAHTPYSNFNRPVGALVACLIINYRFDRPTKPDVIHLNYSPSWP